MNDTSEIIRLTLEHEGGFVNHPKDPGGATNKGITIATYRRYIKRSGTVADLKAMTTAQAVKVYKHQYWDKVRGDELPAGVNYAVFDYGVNSGPSRAIKSLQRAVGADQDGKLGPKTMAWIKTVSPANIIERVCDERLAFMRRIKRGAAWKTFGRGWQRRVDRVRSEAFSMAAMPFPVDHVPVTPAKMARTVTEASNVSKGAATGLIVAGGAATWGIWTAIQHFFGG